MDLQMWIITVFNACLVFILGLLIKPVIDHIKNLIKEVKGFRGDVERIEQELSGYSDRFEGAVHKVYSLESNLWKEISKVRRSLVVSALVIRRRKSETAQLMEDQRRAKDRLESFQKLAEKGAEIFRFHNGEIKKIKTDIIEIKDDLRIFKTKNNGSGK